MGAHKKKLLDNFVSLSLVQGISILFPIITVPYLLRVLGVDGFGIFSLIQVFIMYFDLLISFGFGLTATQHISKNLNDPLHTKQIITTVYLIKFVLFIFSVIVFLGCCIFIPYLKHNFLLVLISTLYLFGSLLFPDWYFQGIQKMRKITVVTFISKSIALLLILILVKHSGDIVYAIFAMSAGNFLAGIMAFIILTKTFPLNFAMPPMHLIKSMFKEGAYVFTSIILAPLYSSVNIFILQAFTNPLMVGYYAIAEKIFSAIGMLTSIANRTFYPHLSYLYSTSVELYKKNIKKLILIFFITFFIFSFIQFTAADRIVKLIAGKNHKDDLSYSIEILKIMSIALLYLPFASFFFQIMVIQNQKKQAIRNMVIVVFFNLVSACSFSYFYGAKGMAINLCLVIFMIGMLNFREVNKKIRILKLPYSAD